MELLVILAILFLADTKWTGRYLARVHKWYEAYYNEPSEDPVREAYIRRRAKNIRRIRNERFRNMK
jgi:hypothetical protein